MDSDFLHPQCWFYELSFHITWGIDEYICGEKIILEINSVQSQLYLSVKPFKIKDCVQ